MNTEKMIFSSCFLVLHYTLSTTTGQLTPAADNVCVYSFSVPRSDVAEGGAGRDCGGSRGSSRLEQDVGALKATVKQQQDQIAAMMQHNAAMLQQYAALTQQIAAMAEDGKINRQQIAVLMQRNGDRSNTHVDETTVKGRVQLPYCLSQNIELLFFN